MRISTSSKGLGKTHHNVVKTIQYNFSKEPKGRKKFVFRCKLALRALECHFYQLSVLNSRIFASHPAKAKRFPHGDQLTAAIPSPSEEGVNLKKY